MRNKFFLFYVLKNKKLINFFNLIMYTKLEFKEMNMKIPQMGIIIMGLIES